MPLVKTSVLDLPVSEQPRLPFDVSGLSHAIHVGVDVRPRPRLVDVGTKTWSCFDRAVIIASSNRAEYIDLASERMDPAFGNASPKASTRFVLKLCGRVRK